MKKLLLIFLLLPFLSFAQIQISTNFSYVVEKGFNEANFAGSGFEVSLRKHLSDKFRTTATLGVYDMRIALIAVSNYDYTSKTYIPVGVLRVTEKLFGPGAVVEPLD